MGTDFYVPLIHSSAKCAPLEALRTRTILVSAFCDTRVTVSYFDRTTGRELQATTYLATRAKAAAIPLDVSAMSSASTSGEVAEYISCHVIAEHPVTLHAFSAGPVECYESMILPTNLLGKDYVVSSIATSGPRADKKCDSDTASSIFVIIATRDNTSVTITPSDYTRTNQHDPFKPFTVVLQRGQVYTVKSRPTKDASLDRSRVNANKPVVVWGATEAVEGDASGITDPDEDLRNTVAQQMLPKRLWSTGPYYMAPLIDPPGLPITDPTSGNELIYYPADTLTRWTHSDLLFNFNTWQLGASSQGVLGGINTATFDSASKPIMVELLDYRAENVNYPVTSPTLMNVLPWSSAVYSAGFVIPSAAKGAESSSYVTLLARTIPDYPQLRYAVDGADSGVLLGRVAPVAQYTLGRETRAWTFRLPGGHAYRFTSDGAFIAYQSNFYGVALTGKVTHGGADSYFFGCSTPLVGRYPAIAGEMPRATASFSCDDSWTIIARGSVSAPLGLATVLRDPHGDYIRLAQDSGYASTNVDGTGALLTPGDTVSTFRIGVRNPLINADAWIQVQNSLGNDTILHLTYIAPTLSQSIDNISFNNAPVGRDSCVSVTYRNIGSDGIDTIRITRVTNSDSTMHVSTSVSLPVALLADDSLTITVCHTGKIETRRDTLHVSLLCGEARVPIEAISAKTMMTANDYKFGSGVVGGSYPRRVAIMNTGNADLLVSRVEHSGSPTLTFTDTARLPYLLEPGASKEFWILFTPVKAGYDTAYLTWVSNAEGTKTVTRLTGKGLLGSLEWSDSVLVLSSASHHADTLRLMNPASPDLGGPIDVQSLAISGPDASDFTLTKNELGYYPLQSFPVAPEQSVWFVIDFALPDSATTTADRHATLTANDLSGYHPQAQLIGKVETAGVAVRSAYGLSLRADGHSLTVSLPEGAWRLALVDALGRTLHTEPASNATELDISTLPAGTYYLRASNASSVVTRAFQVVR